MMPSMLKCTSYIITVMKFQHFISSLRIQVRIQNQRSNSIQTSTFFSDGSMMKLDEVIKNFKGIQFDQNTSEIIIQSEHPILFKPFYTFHPCKVTDVMSKFKESENFILTFFTIYGPMIGLKSEIFNKFDLS